jgi:hypothetical protein
MRPVTVDPPTSIAAVAVYTGRFGSGAASGPGSGQPLIGRSGLVVVGAGTVVGMSVVLDSGDVLDDAGATVGLLSLEQLTNTAAHSTSARYRIVRSCHDCTAAVRSGRAVTERYLRVAGVARADRRSG